MWWLKTSMSVKTWMLKEHDYDSIVSAIIMERYDANKRDAIFANLEMA